MREGPFANRDAVRRRGITPAYAGRTKSVPIPTSYTQDHPRLCGKDRDGVAISAGNAGSPPLMREGRLQEHLILNFCRITPAYAGRTFFEFVPCHVSRDHPRLCGKDQYVFFANSIDSGSPPLMREGLCIYFSMFCYFGITPAYAGRTLII